MAVQQRDTQWIHFPVDGTVEEYQKNLFIQQAAAILQNGELVAFPTETVYGLGADGTSENAVMKIYQAKGRPSDNPLIIHLAKKEQVYNWVESVSPLAEALMDAFWPGPLTLVMRHNGRLAKQVTAGLSTVAIRIPSHPIARALIQTASLPIAAPSANCSGRPSPTRAEHVWRDLKGRISLLLDGGPAIVGVESTVVDVSGNQPILLRPGGISIEEIEHEVGMIQIDPAIQKESESLKPRSPGMKYRHYAPDGEMWLYDGEPSQMVIKIQQEADRAKKEGKKVGILTTEEHQKDYSADLVIACGTRKKPETVVSQLFHTLYQFNQAQVDYIFSESFPEKGAFFSVMNRLKKAASGQIK